MSGIPERVGIVPEEKESPDCLGLNGGWGDVIKKANNRLITIFTLSKQSGLSKRVATARDCVLLELLLALIKEKSFCLIWSIPGCEIGCPGGQSVLGSAPLFGDSLVFAKLCFNEKIFGDHSLPFIIKRGVGGYGIFIDVKKFKRIMEAEE